ncbi:MAG: Galactokinase [Bacteroidota bacterium]
MKKNLIHYTTEQFAKNVHSKPDYVFLSPGRINLIGEHVDYNDGFVLPAAINKYICFAVSKNESTECTLLALDLEERYTFDLNTSLSPTPTLWANYILGVVHQLKEREHQLGGFTMAFSSTIPIGAGLSSSAALECGVGYAMNSLYDLGLSKEDIALIGQKAEHTFAGVNCGIMDQFASVFGKKNSFIKLDCNTLTYDYYKADFKAYSLLLLDSKVKHAHLTSGYNDRRQEVEEGLAVIKQHYSQVKTFRDCTLDMLTSVRTHLGDALYKRCHYVVKEIQRVTDATVAITQSDFKKLGQLMLETHQGLSADYEVSCAEIDFLVAKAQEEPTVLGSRMMGGGFGGCSLNLVTKGTEDALIAKITAQYQAEFGITLKAYKVKIAKGTTLYQH